MSSNHGKNKTLSILREEIPQKVQNFSSVFSVQLPPLTLYISDWSTPAILKMEKQNKSYSLSILDREQNKSSFVCVFCLWCCYVKVGKNRQFKTANQEEMTGLIVVTTGNMKCSKIHLIISYEFVFCLHVYMCTVWMLDSQGGQKKASDHQELKL